MEEKFKLEINAVSPDGEAVNCNTNIKIQCSQGMAVSIIANLMKQEPRMKLILMEAMIISMLEKDLTQPISTDDFLDHILKAREKSEETEL
jgi:hypothetical protein